MGYYQSPGKVMEPSSPNSRASLRPAGAMSNDGAPFATHAHNLNHAAAANENGNANNTSFRSIFGIKRERSNGSSLNLHGSLNDSGDISAAAAEVCNAVFPEQTKMPGLDASNPSMFAAALGVSQPTKTTTANVSYHGHRSSDSIFIPTDDTKRRGSGTAPPPRKGRRRSDEPISAMHKVMSSPSLFMEGLMQEIDAESSMPMNESPRHQMMSLSDGEEAVNTEKLVALEHKYGKKNEAPGTPMNSPSSSMNRVHSMPALAFHNNDEPDSATGMVEDSSTKNPPPLPDEFADTNPEEFLLTIIESLGYSVDPIDTLSVKGFFLEYTPEQIAAYDNEVTGAVRSDDLDALRRIWRSGKTLQCSNRFGESIVHMACRRGSLPVVRFLLDEAGVSIRVRDDVGRTPLHDACWASDPSFDVIQMLIEREPDLLLLCDKRGHTPLAYVRREKWGGLCRFLNEKRDVLAPRGDIVKQKMVL